jgi:hypothetical protein
MNSRLPYLAASLVCHVALAAGTPVVNDPLGYDPTFAAGSVLDDRFAEPGAANTAPITSALLSNGDILTVGIVPAANSSQGLNLGLVHYNTAGQRIGWSAPTPSYASYYNIYLTYPNTTATTYSSVADVKVAFGAIYTIVRDFGINPNGQIIAFTENGTYIGNYPTSPFGDPQLGVSLVPYQDGQNKWLLLIAEDLPQNDEIYMVIKRFAVASNGALTNDSTYNGSTGVSKPTIESCNCTLNPTEVQAARTSTSSPTLYVVGTVPGATPKGFVMELAGSTGQVASATVLDNIVPTRVSVVAGADPAADVLYLFQTDYNDGSCSDSDPLKLAAVTKMLASTLHVDTTFGTSGTSVLSSPHYCTDGLPYEAADMAISGNRIVIVGYDANFYHNLGNSSYYDYDPLAATMRISDGAQTSFEPLPALQENRQPWGDAEFSHIVVQDANHYIVEGQIGRGSYEFGTARLTSDIIFDNGFENP